MKCPIKNATIKENLNQAIEAVNAPEIEHFSEKDDLHKVLMICKQFYEALKDGEKSVEHVKSKGSVSEAFINDESPNLLQELCDFSHNLNDEIAREYASNHASEIARKILKPIKDKMESNTSSENGHDIEIVEFILSQLK